jgi:hypothetical protein
VPRRLSGTQANGCLFWSSDVQSNWEALQRQVPAGPRHDRQRHRLLVERYGGWQWPNGPEAQAPVLVDPAGATAMALSYRDYPELFVRWFQYNAFTRRCASMASGRAPRCGTMARRPSRSWRAACGLRADALYLCAGTADNQSGAPFMRACSWTSPTIRSKTLGDEYMFGPAFLVAPVTEQGPDHAPRLSARRTDWYDWWTDKRYTGGQWIEAAADRSYPAVRPRRSIVPMGVQVPSTATAQALESIRVYPGRDAIFTLYDDDGTTNAYRTGGGRSATLRWNDTTRQLTAGAACRPARHWHHWSGSSASNGIAPGEFPLEENGPGAIRFWRRTGTTGRSKMGRRSMIGLIAMLLATLPAAPGQAAPSAAAQPSIFDKAVNAPGIGWNPYGPNQTARQVAAAEVPGGAAASRSRSHAPGPIHGTAASPIRRSSRSRRATRCWSWSSCAPDATDAAPVTIPVGMGGSEPPYTPIATEPVRVGSTWKRYYVTGVANQAYAAGKANISVQLAGAKQVIEVGPAFLLDLGPGFDRSKLPHN